MVVLLEVGGCPVGGWWLSCWRLVVVLLEVGCSLSGTNLPYEINHYPRDPWDERYVYLLTNLS